MGKLTKLKDGSSPMKGVKKTERKKSIVNTNVTSSVAKRQCSLKEMWQTASPRQALVDTTNDQVVVRSTQRFSRELNKKSKENSDSKESYVLNTVKHAEIDFVIGDEEPLTDDGLCEYERIRLNNIREREALFAQLDFDEVKRSVSPLLSDSAKPSRRGLSATKKEVVEVCLPRRKSARLTGGKVAEIDRYVDEQESEEALYVPFENLSIDNITDSPKSCSDILAYITTSPIQKLEKPIEQSINLNNLTINPERVAKVVPDRIFSSAVHPHNDKILVACGDKWGKVGLWDCEDTESSTHGVHLFNYHSRPVNCLTWDSSDSSRLISTSYEGTSRVFDANKQEAILLYNDPEFQKDGGWTSFHCQPDAHTLLVSQGKEGSVVRIDSRAGTLPVNTYSLFSRVHAKSIASHPNCPYLLMAGHNKGHCCIFDLRTGPKSSSSLVKPVAELIGATKGISSCQFSPISGNEVVTMANDDKIRLYNISNLQASIGPKCQVKHNNQTGRWLTPFRASWHPTSDNIFATGSMERPRQMEVWSTTGGTLTLKHILKGEEFASISSIVAMHPSRSLVLGGNSSGRMHLFM